MRLDGVRSRPRALSKTARLRVACLCAICFFLPLVSGQTVLGAEPEQQTSKREESKQQVRDELLEAGKDAVVDAVKDKAKEAVKDIAVDAALQGLTSGDPVLDGSVKKIVGNSIERANVATVKDVADHLKDLVEFSDILRDFVAKTLEEGAALLRGLGKEDGSTDDEGVVVSLTSETFKCVHCGKVWSNLSDVLRCEIQDEQEMFALEKAEAESARAEAERAYAGATRSVQQSYRDTGKRFEQYAAAMNGEAQKTRDQTAALRQAWESQRHVAEQETSVEQAEVSAPGPLWETSEPTLNNWDSYGPSEIVLPDFHTLDNALGDSTETDICPPLPESLRASLDEFSSKVNAINERTRETFNAVRNTTAQLQHGSVSTSQESPGGDGLDHARPTMPSTGTAPSSQSPGIPPCKWVRALHYKGYAKDGTRLAHDCNHCRTHAHWYCELSKPVVE